MSNQNNSNNNASLDEKLLRRIEKNSLLQSNQTSEYTEELLNIMTNITEQTSPAGNSNESENNDE